MKARKILVSLLAMLLLFSSVQLIAFAETEDHYANLYGDFMLYNEDCREQDRMKHKDDVKLTITKNADPSITVSLPLKFEDEEYAEGFWGEDYINTPEMRIILADVAENTKDMGSELKTRKAAKAMLKNVQNDHSKKLRTKKSILSEEEKTFEGYTVTVEGIEDHYKVTDLMGFITTTETLQAEIDETIKMIIETGGAAYKDYEMPASYIQLMDDYVKVVKGYDSYVDMLKDFEFTDEEIEEELEYFAEQDMILADMRNGEFYGQLYVMGDLECDCPEPEYMTICHEYYKVIDGKRTMIMSDYEDVKVYVGDKLYAKDYAKTTFNDEPYELTETLSYIDRKPMEKIEITEELFFDGFVLCYDYAGSDAGAADTDDDGKDKPNRKPEVVTGEDGPNTGDYTPMSVYLMILLIAASGCAAAIRYRKR